MKKWQRRAGGSKESYTILMWLDPSLLKYALFFRKVKLMEPTIKSITTSSVYSYRLAIGTLQRRGCRIIKIYTKVKLIALRSGKKEKRPISRIIFIEKIGS